MHGTCIPGLVELAAGPWSAALLPAFGMNTAALSFYGKPILRTPPTLRALEESPCAYGASFLLSTSTGCGRFHKASRPCSFAVMERTGRSVLAVYESGGPGALFSVEIRCVLERSGFWQEFVVKNTGGDDLPLDFGLYTSFLEQPRFRVDIGRRLVLDGRLLPTGESVPLQGDERSIPYEARPQGKSIQGLYTAAGHTARVGDILYTVSKDFGRWFLWNGDGRQGFCTLIPLYGVDALGSAEGLPLLKPGECAVFEAAFRYAGNTAGGCPYSLYINDGSQRGTPGPSTGGKHYRRCPPPAGSRPYL